MESSIFLEAFFIAISDCFALANDSQNVFVVAPLAGSKEILLVLNILEAKATAL